MVLVGEAAHSFTPSTGAGCKFQCIRALILALQTSEHASTQALDRRGVVLGQILLAARQMLIDVSMHKFSGFVKSQSHDSLT